MKQMIIKSVLVLGLGVASSVALAQSQPSDESTGQSGATNCTAGSPDCSGSQSGAGNKAEGRRKTNTEQKAQGSSGGSAEQQSQGKGSMTTNQSEQGKTGDACPAGAADCNDASGGMTAHGESKEKTGKAAQGSGTEQNNMQAQGKAGKDQTGSGAAAQGKTTTNKAEGSTDTQMNQQSGQNGSAGTTTNKAQGQNSTTDQTSTGSINNVTVEQKTQVVNVIHEEKVEPVSKIDFEVTVGTAVPRHVHLHRLPARIVKIVPAYESYEYFVLADGRIVIVDPGSLEIVAILTA